MNYWVMAVANYAVFSGRARRAEYWFFTLWQIIFAMIVGIVGVATDALVYVASGEPTADQAPFTNLFLSVYMLATLLPSLAVTVRRLHDTGRSGWLILLGLIPGIGGLILLIFEVKDSQPQTNAYGPNPKAAELPCG
jgi:uncharacterized membrane protein YhaH (DUF805 family)